MSDNPSVSATVIIQLGGGDQALRIVNSLTKSEAELKSRAEATTKAYVARSEAVRRIAEEAKRVELGTTRANEAQERFLRTIQATADAARQLDSSAVNTLNRMRDAAAKTDAQYAALTARMEKAAAIKASKGDYDKFAEDLFASDSTSAPISTGGGSGGAQNGRGVSALNQGLGAVQQLAGSVGATGASQAVNLAGDALATGQALAGVGAGFSTVLAVAAPVALALAGVAEVTKLLTVNADAAAEAERRQLELRKASLDLQLRNTVEQRTLSSKDLGARIDTDKENLEKLRTAIAARNTELTKDIQFMVPTLRENKSEILRKEDPFIQGLIKQYDDLSLSIKNDTEVLKPAIELREQHEKAEKTASEATRARIVDLEKQSASEIQMQQLIRTSTSDTVKARIAQIQTEYQSTQDLVGKLQTLPDTTGDVAVEIQTLQQKLRDLKGEGSQLVDKVLPLIEAREKETKAIEAQKKAYDEQLKSAEAAADQYAANSRKIADLQSEQSDITAKRARDDSRAAQVSALEDQIAAAREAEAEQVRQEKIVSIRQKGAADEVAALNKLRDDRNKLNDSFMQNELRELRSFQKEQSRADDAHRLQRIRSLEDLYTSLSDLAASNDVAGFISAQRSGLRDIRRGDEDTNIASRQRSEDYAEGVQQRADERRQRLADLEQSFFEERTARQKNLREQVDQEESAGKARVLQSAKLQEQLVALRDQWAKEDLVRTRREEDTRIADQIAAIKKRNDELRPLLTKFLDPAANSVKNFATSVGNNLADMFNRVRAAAAGSSTPRPRSGGSGVVAMNALGDVYTKPTLAGLAEVPNYGDAVIPFRQSEGVLPALQRILDKSGGSRGGLTINHLEIKAGSIATPDDLAALRADVLGGIQDAAKALGASGSMVLGSEVA